MLWGSLGRPSVRAGGGRRAAWPERLAQGLTCASPVRPLPRRRPPFLLGGFRISESCARRDPLPQRK